MATMDVFNDDAFSLRSMTAAVNEQDFVPSLLRSRGIFRPRGITTTQFMIEQKDGSLSLVQTTPRGAPPEQKTRNPRTMRSMATRRLSKEAVIYADQVQGVRAFGTESDVETVLLLANQETDEVRSDIDLTEENLMLGAVQGKVNDADGSTIYNLFTEFGVSAPSDVSFALSTATTDVRAKCASVRRTIATNLKAGNVPFKVTALCSDGFFDALIGHKNVQDAYARYQDGAMLRNDLTYQVFPFAGVEFVNYRGTDDGSTVGIATDSAQFFAEGVPGLFELVYAPADTIDTVNTLGLPRYALPFRDPRDKFMSWEIQSNLMPYCTRPQTLVKGTKA